MTLARRPQDSLEIVEHDGQWEVVGPARGSATEGITASLWMVATTAAISLVILTIIGGLAAVPASVICALVCAGASYEALGRMRLRSRLVLNAPRMADPTSPYRTDRRPALVSVERRGLPPFRYERLPTSDIAALHVAEGAEGTFDVRATLVDGRHTALLSGLATVEDCEHVIAQLRRLLPL